MEYSVDFNFFLEHQIGVSQQGKTKYTFFSRLDGTNWHNMLYLNSLTDDQIREKCYEIWKQQPKENIVN